MTASATRSVSAGSASSSVDPASCGSREGTGASSDGASAAIAAVFLAVLLRGVLTTSPSLGGASARDFLVVRFIAVFLVVFSFTGATSASVELSLPGSGNPLARLMEGASGAEEGGPAGLLAARLRRGAG